MNLKSISGLDTASISGGKQARLSSSSPAARKRSKRGTSQRRKNAGSTIDVEYDKEGRVLTRPFEEVVLARIGREPEFATGMLLMGIECLFSDELAIGKEMLRDYVNGTLGFEKLAKKTKIPIKSLMRMLGPSGNPRMTNLSAIIGALKAHAGIDQLHVAAE